MELFFMAPTQNVEPKTKTKTYNPGEFKPWPFQPRSLEVTNKNNHLKGSRITIPFLNHQDQTFWIDFVGNLYEQWKKGPVVL